MSSYPKCPRCDSNLIGGNTHDSEAECIEAMKRENSVSDLLMKKLKSQHAAAIDRAAEWKAKAKAGAPAVATNLTKRVAKVENRSAYSAAKIKDLEARLEKCEQRSNFAVSQVGHMQERMPARRAS